MTEPNVVQIHAPDDALVQERREAKAIVAGIRRGDANAETALIERYRKGTFFFVVRTIADEERARDLVQEVFYIAIEKLRSRDIEQPERLAGFLRGIAQRVMMSAGRKRQREPIPVDLEATVAVADEGRTAFETIAADQIKSVVHATLQSLSVPRDRELLMRYYVYDEEKDGICAELNIDRTHFNRVLYRAKARFRECLREAGYSGVPLMK